MVFILKDTQFKKKQNNTVHTKKNKQTFANLSEHNKSKLNTLTTVKGNSNSKQNLPSEKVKKTVPPKTQGMANKIQQSNIKQIQKQKNTEQNKDSFNLNYLIQNKASNHSEHVEGIIKKTNHIVKSAQKNNVGGIRSNVIGKKSDIKVLTNRGVLWLCGILGVLLILSVATNFLLYSVFKYAYQNPPITITQDMETELFENQSSFFSITLPRQVIPSIDIEQDISVYTLMLNNPIVLRVKSLFTSGDGDVLTQDTHFTQDWTNGLDGYFYYNFPILTGQTISVCTGFTVNEDFELQLNGKNLNVITLVAEAITWDSGLVATVWTTAPTDWTTQIFA